MHRWTPFFPFFAALSLCSLLRAEPTEFSNLNAHPEAISQDANLKDVFTQTGIKPLSLSADPTVGPMTENVMALARSMVGPEDKVKKLHVVIADDMSINAGYVKVGNDAALVVINLGLIHAIPNVDEFGAAFGHELDHGPSELADYIKSIKEVSPFYSVFLKRVTENESDINSALKRQDRAKLNPHAVLSLLHRLRALMGDSGGASHTSFSSRSDSVGGALAVRVRAGLAPDSPYRLDETSRTRGWLGPIKDEFLDTPKLAARQKKLSNEIIHRKREALDDIVHQYQSGDEKATWWGARLTMLLAAENAAMDAVWGPNGESADEIKARLAAHEELLRQIDKTVNEIAPGGVIKNAADFQLLRDLMEMREGTHESLYTKAFSLRERINELGEKSLRARLLQLAESSEEKADREEREKLRTAELAKLQRQYEAARLVYLPEDATQHQKDNFDRRVDDLIERAQEAGRQLGGKRAPWMFISASDTGFTPRHVGPMMQEMKRRSWDLKRQNRELYLNHKIDDDGAFHPGPAEDFQKLFSGSEGAAEFIRIFREGVERNLKERGPAKSRTMLEYLHKYNRRAEKYTGWQDYLDVAVRSGKVKAEEWLPDFIRMLKENATTTAGLNAVGQIVSDIQHEMGSRYYGNRALGQALETLSAEIVAVSPLKLAIGEVGTIDNERNFSDFLSSLNQQLRRQKDRQAHYSEEMKEVVKKLASHLRRLIAGVRPPQLQISPTQAEALIWLSVPAGLRGFEGAETLRESVPKTIATIKKSLEAVEPRFVQYHPIAKFLKPAGVVEFATGDPKAQLNPIAVEIIRGAPVLVDSTYSYDRDNDTVAAKRMQYLMTHHPDDIAVASRLQSREKETLDAIARRNLVSRLRSAGSDPAVFEASVVDYLKEMEVDNTKVDDMYKILYDVVNKEVLSRKTNPSERRTYLAAYASALNAGFNITDPKEKENKVVRQNKPGADSEMGFLQVLLSGFQGMHFGQAFPLDSVLPFMLSDSEKDLPESEVKKLIDTFVHLARNLEKTPDLDHFFSRIWEMTERHPSLRKKFLDESLVGKFFFAENRLKLARWQLEQQFKLKEKSAALHEGRALAPNLGNQRPVIQQIADKITRQFPERSSLRNYLIHEIQESLLTNDVETRLLQGHAIDWSNWAQTPELVYADLPQQLAKGCDTTVERLQLIEYFLGNRPQPPKLKLEKLGDDLRRKEMTPEKLRRLLGTARESFIESARPVKTFILQALLGDGDEGVLENARGEKAVIDKILGPYADVEVVRKFLTTYLTSVPSSEKKVVIAYILASSAEDPNKRISLKTILEALGPMGIYAGQFLRTSSSLPPELRAELDQFFNRALVPFRNDMIEKLKKAFGSHFVNVIGIDMLRGSGKINASIRVRLRSKNGEIRTVTVRMLKDNVATQSRDEAKVMRATLETLSHDTNPEIARMARVGQDAVEHAYTHIGPDGKELSHKNERASLDKVSKAYERKADSDGIRIDVVKVDNEFQRMVGAEFQDTVSVYEDVDHKPLWELESETEREFWAKKILEAERKALLNHGTFDGDGHPGNWLIDRKNKRLVRIDVGQFRSLSKVEYESLHDLMEVLITENPREARLKRIADQFDTLFTTSHKPADLAKVVAWLLKHPNLPPRSKPEERLLFFQEQLQKHYAPTIPDFHVSLSPAMRDAAASINRIQSYAEHTGPDYLMDNLTRGATPFAQVRGYFRNPFIELLTDWAECCVRRLR